MLIRGVPVAMAHLLVAAAWPGWQARAQVTDTLEAVLPEVEIEALRSSDSYASSPYAVSLLSRSRQDVALEDGLSLESSLSGLPGVWINDRGHYALGERLVIRGMGWRAAFGVRGVQALLDGIPLTLADGQAVLDVADPLFIRRAEVVRGPASTFWGNGSGGVLMLNTADFRDSTFARIRAMAGEYGVAQLSGEIAQPVGNHRIHVHASTVGSDGYRDHSSGRVTRAGAHGRIDLGSRSHLSVTTAVAVQDVDAPGSLTLAELDSDPRQADNRNVAAGAGKESMQIQAGATLHSETGLGLVSATAYALGRRLDNPLSFAYIDVDRAAGGLRLQLQGNAGRIDFGLGVDAAFQHDDRLNFNNDGGAPGNDVALDQLERVHSASVFGYVRLDLTNRLSAMAGARADAIRFAMDDRLNDDGDQSGERIFTAASPSLGVSYRLGSTLLFANASTAFETPTTTELVNQPDGSAGFNGEVGAQKTRGFEVGTRGSIGANNVSFDAAVFQLDVRNRLLPFQDEDGRTYYQNAGENLHRGVEVAIRAPLSANVDFDVTYTGSRFVFVVADLDGNRIPGVPDHQLQLALAVERNGLYGRIATDLVSEAYADDTNAATNSGYLVAEVLVGHSDLTVGATQIQPFVKIRNLFDRNYVGSLVVNAFGGRFYEPAAGRTLLFGAGVSI